MLSQLNCRQCNTILGIAGGRMLRCTWTMDIRMYDEELAMSLYQHWLEVRDILNTLGRHKFNLSPKKSKFLVNTENERLDLLG